MMQNLLSALLGALVGGVAAGFGAYVSFSKIIAILQTRLVAIEADTGAMWKRVNNHSHEMECSSKACPPMRTGRVIITE
jgi:hypothetical protein